MHGLGIQAYRTRPHAKLLPMSVRTELEADAQVRQAAQVGGEGRVVEGVEPAGSAVIQKFSARTCS